MRSKTLQLTKVSPGHENQIYYNARIDQKTSQISIKTINWQQNLIITQGSKTIANFESIVAWHFRHWTPSMQNVHIKCPHSFAPKHNFSNLHTQQFVQSVSSSLHLFSKYSRESSVIRGMSFLLFSWLFSKSFFGRFLLRGRRFAVILTLCNVPLPILSRNMGKAISFLTQITTSLTITYESPKNASIFDELWRQGNKHPHKLEPDKLDGRS